MGKNQFRLMGVPWKTCANTYNINDLVKLDKAPSYEIQDWDHTYSELLANAPQLQVRNGGAYDCYFWVKNAWLNDGSNGGDGQDVEGWCNSDGMYAIPTNPEIRSVVNGTLTPGVGAWFVNPLDDGTTMPQMSGAVETDDYELDCPIDFSIRALTVPRNINVNDKTLLKFANIDTTYEIQDWDHTYAELLANAPQIQVQRLNQEVYDCYFYVKNAWLNDGSNGGDGQDVEGWCNSDGMLAIPSNPEIRAEVSGNIPSGSAMWTKGVKSAFKIKFIGLK